ncbi:MAG: helix-turn-helix transcriptional regulator [Clostridiales bacterium]|nr:helix-turn-helix transcriptional regulator [Clostridiales bacterium]
MIEFGEILRELRTDKKLTQPQLAEAIGVSKSMISVWETGLSEPTASNIIKLAKYFEVSTDYLLGLKVDIK